MPKKFKQKIYEKITNDHYIVVINPWYNGFRHPREESDLNYLSAWIRLASLRPDETNLVKTIYKMDSRDEVIVRVNENVDAENLLLGKHEWRYFLKDDMMDEVEKRFKVSLRDRESLIFPYNYKYQGEPAEHQWSEYFPSQSTIPDKIMVKKDYPRPSFAVLPTSNGRLAAIALPLPPQRQRMALTETAQAAALKISKLPYFPIPIPNSNQVTTDNSTVNNTSGLEVTRLKDVSDSEEHTARGLGKCDSDPYEQEEVALNFLHSTRSEVSSGDLPSGYETPRHKSVKKDENYHIKEEDTSIDYVPSDALRKALAPYVTSPGDE